MKYSSKIKRNKVLGACSNMGELERHYGKWKMLETEGFHCLIPGKVAEKANLQRQYSGHSGSGGWLQSHKRRLLGGEQSVLKLDCDGGEESVSLLNIITDAHLQEAYSVVCKLYISEAGLLFKPIKWKKKKLSVYSGLFSVTTLLICVRKVIACLLQILNPKWASSFSPIIPSSLLSPSLVTGTVKDWEKRKLPFLFNQQISLLNILVFELKSFLCRRIHSRVRRRGREGGREEKREGRVKERKK